MAKYFKLRIWHENLVDEIGTITEYILLSICKRDEMMMEFGDIIARTSPLTWIFQEMEPIMVDWPFCWLLRMTFSMYNWT